MLEFAVLSSGSKANCLYVGNGEERILIDCGLSAKQTCLRLQAVGIEPDTISSIVVSHEHSDHIAGIPVFHKRFQSKVFVNYSTYSNCPCLSTIGQEQLSIFDSSREFNIGTITITPFSIMHDASDPVGFRISSGSSCLALVTDLGQVTNLVKEKTKDVDALILECNHEVEMLWEAPYPWELKQRIRSRFGHLSNEQAAEFLAENFQLDLTSKEYTSVDAEKENRKHPSNAEPSLSSCIEVTALPATKSQLAKPKLHYVIAGHISEKSNRPDVALDHLTRVSNKVSSVCFPDDPGLTILAAGPYEPLPLIRV